MFTARQSKKAQCVNHKLCSCRKKITVSIDFFDKTEYNRIIFENEVIEMLKKFEVENYKNFKNRIVLVPISVGQNKSIQMLIYQRKRQNLNTCLILTAYP